MIKFRDPPLPKTKPQPKTKLLKLPHRHPHETKCDGADVEVVNHKTPNLTAVRLGFIVCAVAVTMKR